MIADRPVPGSGTRSPTGATPSEAAHCPSCAMAGIRTHAPHPAQEASKPARSRPGIVVPEPSAQARAESQAILDTWVERGRTAGHGASAAAGGAVPPVALPAPADADGAAGVTEACAGEAEDAELAELFAEVRAEEAQRFADLPPLPPQPGPRATDQQIAAYRQAQIERLKLLGLYEPPGAVDPSRATGPPRAGPYQPRRPPLPRDQAEAELKRRGLY
jgi:hypothetical protein